MLINVKSYRHLVAAILGFTVPVAACAVAGRPTSDPTLLRQDVEEYTLISGKDTVGFELVTRCASRIMGDIDSRQPRAFIHYAIDSISSGYPKRLSIAIWSGTDSVGGQPTQVARHVIVGDTAFTEVVRGAATQRQRALGQIGMFPFMTRYMGLYSQLLTVLSSRQVGAKPVVLLYLGTDGRIGSARVVDQTTDSLVIRLDSTEIHNAWSLTGGFGGATVAGSSFRIVRSSPRVLGDAASRCNKPSFLFDVPGRMPVIRDSTRVGMVSGR